MFVPRDNMGGRVKCHHYWASDITLLRHKIVNRDILIQSVVDRNFGILWPHKMITLDKRSLYDCSTYLGYLHHWLTDIPVITIWWERKTLTTPYYDKTTSVRSCCPTAKCPVKNYHYSCQQKPMLLPPWHILPFGQTNISYRPCKKNPKNLNKSIIIH